MSVEPPAPSTRGAGPPSEPWSARSSAYRSRSAPRFVIAGSHRAAWLSDSSCSSTFPQASRAVSEPPQGALQLGRETDEGHGPERLFYDQRSYTGICRPTPSAAAGANAALGEWRDLLRPGLRSGSTFASRGQNLPGQAEAHVKLGRETQTDKGPERLFYDTTGYTGTRRHGGPSVVETGPLREVRVAGFTGKVAAAANGSYRRRGDLDGRPTFEKLGGGMFIYSIGKKWCISPQVCDSSKTLLAYADCLAHSPPNGAWRLNPGCAAGSPVVTSDERCGELSDVTRQNLRSGAAAQTACRPSVHRARPRSAPQVSQQHYEVSTSTSSRRKSTHDHIGLALRPGLSSGSTYMSSCSGPGDSPTCRRFLKREAPRKAPSSSVSPKPTPDVAPGAPITRVGGADPRRGRGAVAGRRRGRCQDAAKGPGVALRVGAAVAHGQQRPLSALSPGLAAAAQQEDNLSLALRQLGLGPPMVTRLDFDEAALGHSPAGEKQGEVEGSTGRASGFSLKLSVARVRSLRVV